LTSWKEESMEEETGLTTISKTRVLVNMIKEFLRHPFLKAGGVLGEAGRIESSLHGGG
jgi:hypothetical protein